MGQAMSARSHSKNSIMKAPSHENLSRANPRNARRIRDDTLGSRVGESKVLMTQSTAKLNVARDTKDIQMFARFFITMAIAITIPTEAPAVEAPPAAPKTSPEDPVKKAKDSPFRSSLVTPWGEDVRAENAWLDYPRPQLARDQWQNLNGNWSYAVSGADDKTVPSQWDGEILVPFCLESKLGGVQRHLQNDEALWYRRTFQVSLDKAQRTLLNFEAVDYRCEIMINGHVVGTHQGGNTPFSFDITEALREGENELVVRVEDDTEEWQLHGKQTNNPRGIWYTPVSGIWQTVWMEQVGGTYIRDLKIETNASTGTLTVIPQMAGDNGPLQSADCDQI